MYPITTRVVGCSRWNCPDWTMFMAAFIMPEARP